MQVQVKSRIFSECGQEGQVHCSKIVGKFVLLALKWEEGRVTYKVTPGLALTMVRVVMYDNMELVMYLELSRRSKNVHINCE